MFCCDRRPQFLPFRLHQVSTMQQESCEERVQSQGWKDWLPLSQERAAPSSGPSRRWGWRRAVPASRSLQSQWLETENKPRRFAGKYLLLRQPRRQLGIMLCYLSRAAGFCAGTAVCSCVFPSMFKISSSCSIKMSCWNKCCAEIKLGSKQMGDQGLLLLENLRFSNPFYVCSLQ